MVRCVASKDLREGKDMRKPRHRRGHMPQLRRDERKPDRSAWIYANMPSCVSCTHFGACERVMRNESDCKIFPRQITLRLAHLHAFKILRVYVMLVHELHQRGRNRVPKRSGAARNVGSPFRSHRTTLPDLLHSAEESHILYCSHELIKWCLLINR